LPHFFLISKKSYGGSIFFTFFEFESGEDTEVPETISEEEEY
jgi:hypothetical protein